MILKNAPQRGCGSDPALGTLSIALVVGVAIFAGTIDLSGGGWPDLTLSA
jgi:hypothetical protein